MLDIVLYSRLFWQLMSQKIFDNFFNNNLAIIRKKLWLYRNFCSYNIYLIYNFFLFNNFYHNKFCLTLTLTACICWFFPGLLTIKYNGIIYDPKLRAFSWISHFKPAYNKLYILYFVVLLYTQYISPMKLRIIIFYNLHKSL